LTDAWDQAPDGASITSILSFFVSVPLSLHDYEAFNQVVRNRKLDPVQTCNDLYLQALSEVMDTHAKEHAIDTEK